MHIKSNFNSACTCLTIAVCIICRLEATIKSSIQIPKSNLERVNTSIHLMTSKHHLRNGGKVKIRSGVAERQDPDVEACSTEKKKWTGFTNCCFHWIDTIQVADLRHSSGLIQTIKMCSSGK
jgi:hypothetical protein